MSQVWTPPPNSGAPASVPNYMVPSIISLFCCLPLGIVAVIFAARVNGQVQSGDTAGALDSSRKAKMFSYIGLILGLIWIAIWIVMTVLGVGIGALSNS
ncbi:MAG: hypothetical protein V7638_3740 [Acidobacteriota bacterium]